MEQWLTSARNKAKKVLALDQSDRTQAPAHGPEDVVERWQLCHLKKIVRFKQARFSVASVVNNSGITCLTPFLIVRMQYT
jgi:hypothetical protein